MIVKVIPETDAEKQRMQEVTHAGVRDFFMFGNKTDGEGGYIDFHDWSGSYRYLEGSLYHFLTTITEEKKFKARTRQQEVPLQRFNAPTTPFIKTGEVDGQSIKVIDVNNLEKKDDTATEGTMTEQPKVIPFPSPNE